MGKKGKMGKNGFIVQFLRRLNTSIAPISGMTLIANEGSISTSMPSESFRDGRATLLIQCLTGGVRNGDLHMILVSG